MTTPGSSLETAFRERPRHEERIREVRAIGHQVDTAVHSHGKTTPEDLPRIRRTRGYRDRFRCVSRFLQGQDRLHGVTVVVVDAVAETGLVDPVARRTKGRVPVGNLLHQRDGVHGVCSGCGVSIEIGEAPF